MVQVMNMLSNVSWNFLVCCAVHFPALSLRPTSNARLNTNRSDSGTAVKANGPAAVNSFSVLFEGE